MLTKPGIKRVPTISHRYLTIVLGNLVVLCFLLVLLTFLSKHQRQPCHKRKRKENKQEREETASLLQGKGVVGGVCLPQSPLLLRHCFCSPLSLGPFCSRTLVRFTYFESGETLRATLSDLYRVPGALTPDLRGSPYPSPVLKVKTQLHRRDCQSPPGFMPWWPTGCLTHVPAISFTFMPFNLC